MPSAVSTAQRLRPHGGRLIALAAIACLVLAHGMVKSYGLGYSGYVGVALAYAVLARTLYRDQFAALMAIYVCSLFNMGEYLGGLFNLLAFGLLVPYLIRYHATFRAKRLTGLDLEQFTFGCTHE